MKATPRAVPTDASALTADLYVRYRQRIFGLLYHLLGIPETAEDLTQETFIRALRRLPSTPIDGDVYYWLAQIARNLARDYARRAARYPAVAWHPGLDRADDTRTEHAILAADTVHELRAALATLPAGQRTALLLAAAGVDCATSARVLGCSPEAIRLLRWRARRRAQATLGAWGFWV